MFGERLRQIRKEKNLTLDALSELYNAKFGGGLNKGTLSKYENEKQEPMISVVNNLATILNVSLDYLLGKDNIILNLAANSQLETIAGNQLPFEFSPHEVAVITAYRNRPHMQPAVDTLLGVEKESDNYTNDTAKLEISEELSPIDEKIEQQVEEYRRSLEAEQKRKELSAYYASSTKNQKDSTKKAN